MATLNIPQNTCVNNNQPRMNVVQMLCNALLDGYKVMIDNGPYRPGTYYVYQDGNDCILCTSSSEVQGHKLYEFTNEEVQMAFNALKEHGYFIMLEVEHGSYKKYFCSKTGTEWYGHKVTSFVR